MLDERGKAAGERRRDGVVLGLESIPNGPEPSGSIGITNRTFLRERETWRDRITGLDRIVPFLGLS